ncbi:hypothetical protein MP228_011579 [Amoeboaphelidium protococcarum]|nr:hypothetical protein MP228_011579 [Amoeboaphelidium protococcarum]
MEEVKQLYQRKLYHQFTVKLLEFIKQRGGASVGQDVVAVFEQMVQPAYTQMNKVSYAQISVAVSKFYAQSDSTKAITFLTQVAEKLYTVGEVEQAKTQQDDQMQLDSGDNKQVSHDPTESCIEGFILVSMQKAQFQLMQNQLAECKSSMETCASLLEKLPVVEAFINEAFYRVSADYYKSKADYGLYYKNALLYLASVNLNELPDADKASRAFDLSIAALLSEDIYNFGELLLHPILGYLKSPQSAKSTPSNTSTNEWLFNLLHVFNRGDIKQFDELSKQTGNFSSVVGLKDLLGINIVALRQKLCLMSLVEVVFKSGGVQMGVKGKVLPFDVIASETKLPMNEIEHLIMRALSLQILKGRIDQVSGVLMVESVQNRVLDMSQIENLKKQIDQWSSRVVTLVSEVQ